MNKKLSNKIYYLKNKRILKEKAKKYCAANKEKIKQKRKDKPDKVKQWKTKYYRLHRDKILKKARLKWRSAKILLHNANTERLYSEMELMLKKAQAYDRRKVWKQLKYDYEWRYYLKTA